MVTKFSSPRLAPLAAAALTTSAVAGIAVGAFGPQVAALAAGIVAVAGLLRSPGVALSLYVLVPPLLKGLLQPYVPVDLTVLLGAICLMHVAYGLVAKPIHVDRTAAALWIAVLGMIAAGSLYAPDQGLAAEKVVSWAGLVFAPLLVAFWVASDPREVRRFVWSSLVVGVVVTLAALVTYSPSHRLVADFTTTINVGRASLLVPIIVFLFVLRDGPSWARLPLLAIVPLTFVASIAAGATTAPSYCISSCWPPTMPFEPAASANS